MYLDISLLPRWIKWLLITLIIAVIVQSIVEWRRRKKLPPGPWGLPIIGSLFWLGFNPHVSLTKMTKVYGDIITITFGSYTSIVLNSIESVRETLVKHSHVYAGRPQLYSFTEVREGLGILFIDFTPKYQRQRKLAVRSLHRAFYQNNQLDSMLAHESTKIVEEFAKYQNEPFDPKSFLRLLAANVILKSFFDIDFEFSGDVPRDIVDHVEEFTSSTSPVNLSDIIPWLQKLPISNTNKMKSQFQDFIDMHQRLYSKTTPTRRIAFPRNVTDALLDNLHLYNKGVTDKEELITENDLVYILADLVGAAFETIANTLSWALLYMAAYPEWQIVVQSELDAVVGRTRLPCVTDRERLPNVQAALYEVLRKGCVLPLTLPHSTTQRTKLRDYDIPKGTFVFVNLWAIHHDPKYWDSPYEFNPGRFLDENGHFISNLQSLLPFSTGARSCLGEKLAKDEIFVFFAAILQQFSLKLASNDIDFDGDFRLTLAPQPYLLKVEKRV